MFVLSSVSERMHGNLPEEAHVPGHALKKNTSINLNKSSMTHDFTDLHVKLGIYGRTKEHRWKEAQ